MISLDDNDSEARRRVRWRPQRAGVFNIWEYDDQVFEFGDGRLVLRGRNGSGKSNALSLLFPFLLDGVMSASRMDPMGGARSMKSLLLGRSDDSANARYRHDSGTGYVWMEFESGPDGESQDENPSTLTIGVGASATTQRDADSWFFITPLRIGVDIELHDDDVPKTRRRLTESLEQGDVFVTADDYRRALDRRLFGLGPDRYRTLVDLLLTLRRPHLAGKLDPDHLSATLSAGLAELDAGLVEDVAHSFDDLDAMQHELEAMAASLDAVERFLPVYRNHLVSVARLRADAVVEARRALRSVWREHDDAEAERDEATDAAEQDRVVIAGVTDDRERIEVEIETIQVSPAYQSATALAEVERSAATARSTASDQADTAERTSTQAGSADDSAAAAHRRREAGEAKLAAEVTDWITTTHAVGIEWRPEDRSAASFPVDRALAAVARRRSDVGGLLEGVRASEAAAAESERRRVQRGQAEADLDTAQQDVDDATATVDHELDDLDRHRRIWAAETDETLAAADTELADDRRPTRLVTSIAESVAMSAADEEVESLDGANEPEDSDAHPALALGRSLDDALGDTDRELQRVLDRVERDAGSQRALHDELGLERRRIADEPNPGPPPNPTRPDAPGADGTDGTSGVPLYACVDFADHVIDADRPGLEAALAGAGILDARIAADGIDDRTLDAALVGSIQDAGRTLADLLVPVAVSGLTVDQIDAALRSVPIDSDTIRISPNGTWRLGPLAGRFAQDASMYVGHEARERRRVVRLAELDATIAEAFTGLAEIEAHIDRLVALRESIEVARALQPPAVTLRSALRSAATAFTVASERQRLLETAMSAADVADEVAASASAELQRSAVALALPSTRRALDDIAAELIACGGRIKRVSQLEDARIDAADAAAQAAATATEMRATATDAAERAATAERAADNEAERYELLRRDVGADAQQAVADLAGAKARRRRVDERLDSVRALLAAHEQDASRLAERVTHLGSDIERCEQARDASALRFAPICSNEVVDVLDVDDLTVDSEPHDGARAVLVATSPVGDDATNKMERAYREIILDGLRAGNDPSMPKLDGFDVIRVVTSEGEVALGALAARLRVDNERHGSLLSTKEREIFETHLLTNIGDSIRRLLLDADEFEQRINAEMSKAPTASEMTVELKWNVEAEEAGLRGAVDLLRRSPDMLSPEQRETLRSFFVQRIDDVRAADPGLSFAETLATALDYRDWHRFDLFARFADGKRQRMTRAFFRGLSGGEQAVVLHLPLFAAAAAQYESGTEAGPRLVALDEAFVGIDDQMRARLMGLLTQLDLDLVVTSHEFWGFYEQVPNLVVYDLIRNPSTPGVFAQRFDWRANT